MPRSRRSPPGCSLPLREEDNLCSRRPPHHELGPSYRNSEASESTQPPTSAPRRLGRFPHCTSPFGTVPSTVRARQDVIRLRICEPRTPTTRALVHAAGTIAESPSPTLVKPCTSPLVDRDIRPSPESCKAASLKKSQAEPEPDMFQVAKDMFARHERRRAQESALEK